MARKKTPKFNHRRRIINQQPAKLKAIYPGMFLTFRYPTSISDKNPLVLVLWNDFKNHIEGINLNYMTEGEIKKLMEKMIQGASTYAENLNIIKKEDQTSGGQGDEGSERYDDTLPNRNLLDEPYTKMDLPTYKGQREGNPLSKAEARVQMKQLYNKVLVKQLPKYDVYRTYRVDKMSAIKVIEYNTEGLI
tara:strand:+ start:202 stop:774 length:573 start_codon:yes stop_codon:yes gene_type:complete